MNAMTARIYNLTLQVSVIAFTAALFWFAFIYYPKVVSEVASGKVLTSRSIQKPVYAQSTQFPIETSAYRIVYEDRSGTYYAFISGAKLDEFTFNRDNAKLALKTALSMENLCSVNVIYASVEKLSIPSKFQNTNC